MMFIYFTVSMSSSVPFFSIAVLFIHVLVCLVEHYLEFRFEFRYVFFFNFHTDL